MSVVLSHRVYGYLLQQSQETNTVQALSFQQKLFSVLQVTF